MNRGNGLTGMRNLQPTQHLPTPAGEIVEQLKHHLDARRLPLNRDSSLSSVELSPLGSISVVQRGCDGIYSQAIACCEASDVKPVYEAGENS